MVGKWQVGKDRLSEERGVYVNWRSEERIHGGNGDQLIHEV